MEGVKPLLIENNTLVPVRFVAEAFGGKVDWDGASSRVTVAMDGKRVQMKINQKQISVNGVVQTVDIGPRLAGDIAYLPLRTLGDVIGKTTVYDPATDMIIIRSPEAEAVEYRDLVLEDIRWWLQGQPVIYCDDDYVFLDRPEGIAVRDKDRRQEQLLSAPDGFVSPVTTVDGVGYYLLYTGEPTLGSNALYAVEGKQVKRIVGGDIVDFRIYNGGLYYLTDEFSDYFSAPDHKNYEGNLYYLPLQEADGSLDHVKRLGTPGYFYGFYLELIHYDKDTLMVWQTPGEARFTVSGNGIEAPGVDLRTTAPEKTMGYYRVPLDGSPQVKLRDLTADEYEIAEF